MAEQNFPDNVLYNMDNLDVLRGMNSETIDLIATDPPFNKKRNRSASAGQYEDAWRWENDPSMAQRPDQWLWQPVHRIWLDQIEDENPALFQVIEATRLTQDNDTAAFLCFLGVRLMEMHRVLKPTGSIYLHCDHTANAYIRTALDAVFGAKNFRNEIVWKRNSSHNDSRSFGKITDSLFYYIKGTPAIFNQDSIRVPLDAEYVKKNYRHEDARGLYRSDNLTAKSLSGGGYEYEFHGHTGPWRYPEKRMTELESDGRIHFPSKPNGVPALRRYLHENKGQVPSNLWTDISVIGAQSAERTGSPDQKPLALYERIIRASSNEGDLVLDPFAGCATTPIAAHNLGRRWVGIDRREDAAFHITNRLLGLGINVDEFKARQQHLIPELQGRCEIRHEPPERTDGKKTAAPELGPVYRRDDRPILSHREMKDFLVKTFGTRCWGCDFDVKDDRYLQLDHAEPKADGGSNDLDNRTLLCGPCNLAKSRRITLGQLRRQNVRDGYLRRPAGARRGDDAHPHQLAPGTADLPRRTGTGTAGGCRCRRD